MVRSAGAAEGGGTFSRVAEELPLLPLAMSESEEKVKASDIVASLVTAV